MSETLMDVRVADKWRETDEIVGLSIARADGAALPAYSPGAHIDVEVAPGLIRQYSLCQTFRARTYRIGVLRTPQSRGGSQHLVERVSVGDRLRISTPRNNFSLVPDASHSILIAGGIGITPLLCMADHLHAAGSEFTLHYCVRSQSRAAFLGLIDNLGLARQTRMHYSDGGAGKRLNLDEVLSARQPGQHVYVCGPAGMIESATSAARRWGWPDSHVHREFFAAAAFSGSVDDEFEVRIASSGRQFLIPANKPISSVLQHHGVAVPLSCEQGVCGTCLTRVLEGAPEHRDSFLTSEERARNDQLLLCCSRSKSKLLVLDL